MAGIFYFSGLASRVEADLFREAGVKNVLVDPKDLANADGFENIALDSGAYRAFKSQTSLDIPAYLELARSRPFAFHVAPDVIGNAELTRANWLAYRQPGMAPVWQWGDSRENLLRYLDEAPLVCIGGLVQLMRAKDEAMLAELRDIVATHGTRLHVLGMNWVKSINELKDSVASFDSSKCLDSARYGHAFIINSRTSKLQQLPHRILEETRSWDRRKRILESARVMNEYCNGDRIGRPVEAAAE
jgi:hypothetical protein